MAQDVLTADIEGEEVTRRPGSASSDLTVQANDQTTVGQRLQHTAAMTSRVTDEVKRFELGTGCQSDPVKSGEDVEFSLRQLSG
jgi:hypothetical protein